MGKSPKKQPIDVRLEKLLYAREDAAFVLSISVREVDRLISEKAMRTRRYGRRVLIPADDVRHVAETILQSDMLQGAASARQ